MAEPAILAPIELTDDELAAVSGGRNVNVARASISQSIRQHQDLAQVGGDLTIGGGNGATTASNVSFTESFSASQNQSATNTNSGNATATATATQS